MVTDNPRSVSIVTVAVAEYNQARIVVEALTWHIMRETKGLLEKYSEAEKKPREHRFETFLMKLAS